MIFRPTKFKEVFLIEPELLADERGFFARSWCAREFAEKGLTDRFVQCNISYNRLAGTVRGMHYQAPPVAEAKLVRCTRGAIDDVVVDIRRDSPTLGQWQMFELTAENRRMLYVPEGFAHGFQTQSDDTEVMYQMSEFYHAESARGFRHDDPAFGIRWRLPVRTISSRDRSHPRFAA